MNDVEKFEPREVSHATSGEPRYCRYCGAALSDLFYFCLGCGTPYKDPMRVLTRARPRRMFLEEMVAERAPHVANLFWTYMAVIVGVNVLSFLMVDEGQMELRIVFATTAIFITTCVVGVIYWRSLVGQLRRIGFFSPAAWAGIALLIPLLALNFAYHELLLRQMAERYVDVTDELHKAGMTQGGILMIFCIFPAITEETAFRGLLQHWLQVAIKPWHAILLGAGLFAAVHFSIVSFPYLMLVGVLLGWMKWETGSLYPSMLAHFLHNYVVIQYFGQWMR